MIVVSMVMVSVLTVACGSAGDDDVGAPVGSGSGSASWAPPKASADISGRAAAATPSEPPGTCAPLDSRHGDEPVTSDEPRACGPQAVSRLGTVLITEGSGRFRSASIAIRDDTDIRRRASSGYEKAGFAALTPGSQLRVWFEGPVAESSPVQGTAGTIVIDA